MGILQEWAEALGQLGNGGAVVDEKVGAVAGENAGVAEAAQGAGEGFAGEIELAGKMFFHAGEGDAAGGGVGGGEQVPGDAAEGVAQGDIFDAIDHVFNPTCHAFEQSQAKGMIGCEGGIKGAGGEQHTAGIFQSFGESGTGEIAHGGHFGKGSTGGNKMQDMFFAIGGSFENADQAAADQEDAGTGLSLAENHGAGGPGFQEGHLPEPGEGGIFDIAQECRIGKDYPGIIKHKNLWRKSRQF